MNQRRLWVGRWDGVNVDRVEVVCVGAVRHVHAVVDVRGLVQRVEVCRPDPGEAQLRQAEHAYPIMNIGVYYFKPLTARLLVDVVERAGVARSDVRLPQVKTSKRAPNKSEHSSK